MNFKIHLGGGDWDTEIQTHWWPPQQAALAKAFAYLEQPQSRHAMVRMPTGSGKTAVIAALSRLLQDYPKCIVVAPWRGLVEQLRNQIDVGFWEKTGLTHSLPPTCVRVALPSTIASDLGQMAAGGVLICTYQTLQALSLQDFGALKAWATLILADEGHREPAPKWADAIRRLEKPTILFTATPYRNDLQFFDLDPTHCYTYTFPEAQQAHQIRNVAFSSRDWPEAFPASVDPFVDIVRQARENILINDGITPADCRVIIRCESAPHIKAITSRLLTLGESAVGIHETFKVGEATGLYNTVPDPVSEGATYWVHQFKLLEGLDDSKFRIAAIHGSFRNARNLVQQVGRIIRNPQFDQHALAHVIFRNGTNQGALWQRFCEYEEEIRVRVAQGGSEVDYIAGFLSNMASGNQFYFLGNFRSPLDPMGLQDPRGSVQMRKTVAVFQTKASFDWEECADALDAGIRQSDSFTFGPKFQDGTTYLQFVLTASQSSFTDDAFLDVKLGYIFARQLDTRLYWFGTVGSIPDYVRIHCDLERPEFLGRLLPDQVSTIGEVSLINGDFANRVFRRRSLSAENLDEVPPMLSDYVHLCTTASGSTVVQQGGVSVQLRRYLGFSKSKVSQRTKPVASFIEFEEWLADIHATLSNGTLMRSDAFARFASPSTLGQAAVPVHVLFDVSAEGLDGSGIIPVNPPIATEEVWRVTGDDFIGEIESLQFRAKLRFDTERKEYRIAPADGTRIGYSTDADPKHDYFDHLNETQDFRVLMSDGSFYCQGRFLKPNNTPWKGGGLRVNIGGIVRECASLATVQSEKGQVGDDWAQRSAPNSVFGCILDANGIFHTAGFDPEILVCGDVAAPEVADFFALDPPSRRLIMIHAKSAKVGSKLSASSFHDVCSQATRYLRFFNPNETKARLTSTQIRRQWKPSNHYTAQKRLVWSAANKGVDAVVTAFNEAIRDAAYQREVWIVMGHGMSRRAFRDAMKKSDPAPNERELAYLLQSTWSSCASVGASLTVFCKP